VAAACSPGPAPWMARWAKSREEGKILAAPGAKRPAPLVGSGPNPMEGRGCRQRGYADPEHHFKPDPAAPARNVGRMPRAGPRAQSAAAPAATQHAAPQVIGPMPRTGAGAHSATAPDHPPRPAPQCRAREPSSRMAAPASEAKPKARRRRLRPTKTASRSPSPRSGSGRASEPRSRCARSVRCGYWRPGGNSSAPVPGRDAEPSW